jgi:hypothetical protein
MAVYARVNFDIGTAKHDSVIYFHFYSWMMKPIDRKIFFIISLECWGAMWIAMRVWCSLN